MIKEVLVAPNPMLNKRAKKVQDHKIVKSIIEDLVDTTRHNVDIGVGLSAPQIGYSYQIMTIFVDDLYVVINPVLMNASNESTIEIEGCLSLPEIFLPILRPQSVCIHGTNEKGKHIRLNLNGYEARVAMHELDHLYSILITERHQIQSDLNMFSEYDKIKDSQNELEVI